METDDNSPADIMRQLADRHATQAVRALGGDDESGLCIHALRRALAKVYTDHLRRVVETTAWPLRNLRNTDRRY